MADPEMFSAILQGKSFHPTVTLANRICFHCANKVVKNFLADRHEIFFGQKIPNGTIIKSY
ncbi:MAG: hypothetical protein ABI575_07710 [Oxalobacteraceae bacterium]